MPTVGCQAIRTIIWVTRSVSESRALVCASLPVCCSSSRRTSKRRSESTSRNRKRASNCRLTHNRAPLISSLSALPLVTLACPSIDKRNLQESQVFPPKKAYRPITSRSRAVTRKSLRLGQLVFIKMLKMFVYFLNTKHSQYLHSDPSSSTNVART